MGLGLNLEIGMMSCSGSVHCWRNDIAIATIV